MRSTQTNNLAGVNPNTNIVALPNLQALTVDDEEGKVYQYQDKLLHIKFMDTLSAVKQHFYKEGVLRLTQRLGTRYLVETELDVSRRLSGSHLGLSAHKSAYRPSIFISYAQEVPLQQRLTKYLCKHLELLGFHVYFDQRNLHAGDTFEGFERQIETATFVLVIATPLYKAKYDFFKDHGQSLSARSGVSDEMGYIEQRLNNPQLAGSVIPLVFSGALPTIDANATPLAMGVRIENNHTMGGGYDCLPQPLSACFAADCREDGRNNHRYYTAFFHLLKKLYAISEARYFELKRYHKLFLKMQTRIGGFTWQDLSPLADSLEAARQKVDDALLGMIQKRLSLPFACEAKQSDVFVKYAAILGDTVQEQEQEKLLQAIEKGESFTLTVSRVKKQASFVWKDVLGDTPLHYSAALGRAMESEQLLRGGADKNAQNAAGDTPLSEAAAHGELTTTALLLAHGADATQKNRESQTPFDRALRAAVSADTLTSAQGESGSGVANAPVVTSSELSVQEAARQESLSQVLLALANATACQQGQPVERVLALAETSTQGEAPEHRQINRVRERLARALVIELSTQHPDLGELAFELSEIGDTLDSGLRALAYSDARYRSANGDFKRDLVFADLRQHCQNAATSPQSAAIRQLLALDLRDQHRVQRKGPLQTENAQHASTTAEGNDEALQALWLQEELPTLQAYAPYLTAYLACKQKDANLTLDAVQTNRREVGSLMMGGFLDAVSELLGQRVYYWQERSGKLACVHEFKPRATRQVIHVFHQGVYFDRLQPSPQAAVLITPLIELPDELLHEIPLLTEQQKGLQFSLNRYDTLSGCRGMNEIWSERDPVVRLFAGRIQFEGQALAWRQSTVNPAVRSAAVASLPQQVSDLKLRDWVLAGHLETLQNQSRENDLHLQIWAAYRVQHAVLGWLSRRLEQYTKTYDAAESDLRTQYNNEKAEIDRKESAALVDIELQINQAIVQKDFIELARLAQAGRLVKESHEAQRQSHEAAHQQALSDLRNRYEADATGVANGALRPEYKAEKLRTLSERQARAAQGFRGNTQQLEGGMVSLLDESQKLKDYVQQQQLKRSISRQEKVRNTVGNSVAAMTASVMGADGSLANQNTVAREASAILPTSTDLSEASPVSTEQSTTPRRIVYQRLPAERHLAVLAVARIAAQSESAYTVEQARNAAILQRFLAINYCYRLIRNGDLEQQKQEKAQAAEKAALAEGHRVKLEAIERQKTTALAALQPKINAAVTAHNYDLSASLSEEAKLLRQQNEQEKKAEENRYATELAQLEQSHQEQQASLKKCCLPKSVRQERLFQAANHIERLTETIDSKNRELIKQLNQLAETTQQLRAKIEEKTDTVREGMAPKLPNTRGVPFLFQEKAAASKAARQNRRTIQHVKQRSAEVKAKYTITDAEVKNVLDAVVRGRLEEVEAALEANKGKNNGYCALLHVQGDTREAEQKFYEMLPKLGGGSREGGSPLMLTPWQFALRESDLDMCDLILRYFNDQNENRAAAEQMNALREDKVLIQTYGSPFFDLQATNQAYKTLQANWGSWSWDEREKHWCEVIGKHQQSWPAWLRYDFTQPGEDAPWCKKTVKARPQKRDASADGMASIACWMKGYENKYGLGGPVNVNGSYFGFAWWRGAAHGMLAADLSCRIAEPTKTICSAPAVDRSSLDNEQAAVVPLTEKSYRPISLHCCTIPVRTQAMRRGKTPQPSHAAACSRQARALVIHCLSDAMYEIGFKVADQYPAQPTRYDCTRTGLTVFSVIAFTLSRARIQLLGCTCMRRIFLFSGFCDT